MTDGAYSKSRISNYGQGLRRLSVEAAQTLAEVLGVVSAAHLLFVEDDPPALSDEETELLGSFPAADAEGRAWLLACARRARHPAGEGG
jgi:hypothetical protein